MAKLESRTFPQQNKPSVKHLLVLAENEQESKLIDTQLGSKIPTSIQGEVTLADGYLEHYIRLYSVSNNDDNYWRWQGDGHDYTDSLTCPILIQPQQLREILAAVAAAKFLITSILAHVSHGGPTRADAEKVMAELNKVRL